MLSMTLQVSSATSVLKRTKPTAKIPRKVVMYSVKNDDIGKEKAKEVIKKAMDESLENVFDQCDHDGASHKECIVAWDEYWDLERAYYTAWEEWVEDKKDPLKAFCNKYPWTTECKEYDV